MGRTVVVLVLGILLLGAAAGCLGGKAAPKDAKDGPGGKKIAGTPRNWTLDDAVLSPAIFTEILFEALPVMATDGVRLDNWIYRPKTPDDVKVPTIIHLSPYFGSSLPAGGGRFDKVFLRDLLAPRGYAVVMASVRGTGYSGGCFEIGGPRERQDYNELFAHIAKQPWSNGLVGLIGVSYDGTAPQGALVSSSPALKTIVPIAAISEWYKYNFVKGVQIIPQGYVFNTYYVGGQTGTGVRPDRVAEDAQQMATRPCLSQGSNNGPTRGPALVDTQRAQLATALTGTTDAYWEERNFTRMLDKVRPNVSVLVVHGLVDYNVKTHNLLPWYTELQRHNVSTKILLGQWGHAYPATTRPNGLVEWNTTLLRWFDFWLKGLPTGIMDEPNAMIQDNARVWRTEDNYPPTRATPSTWYFHADGSLKNTTASGTKSFVDSGQPFSPARADSPAAASFLGPRLEKEFRYSGEAYATLRLSHTAPRGQVAVVVYEVTGTTWRPLNYGFYNYNIRNAADKYDPVVPNEQFTLRVPLLPTDLVFKAGSQLAVAFSGNSADAVSAWGLLGGGGPNMFPPPSGGQTTIYLDKSSITFPSLDGIVPLEPQPRVRGTT